VGSLVRAGGADTIAVFAIRPGRADIGGYGGSSPPGDDWAGQLDEGRRSKPMYSAASSGLANMIVRSSSWIIRP
jgi:hypothetical protein